MATGAVLVGRRTFDIAGRWNGDHHDGVPIFVPTRGEPPEPAWDRVHYVTDGVESAMVQAKEAAGDADVMVHGATLAQSCSARRVLDELEIHLIPLLLGAGRRLFDGERVRARAHPRHRRTRGHPPALPGGGMSERRLILHMSVSLDGFVANRDGVIDWLTPGDGVDHGNRRHRANLEMLGEVGLIVLGRGAYEEMAGAWSSSDSPMAVLINALPKIVYSQSLSEEPTWNNTRISHAALSDEIPALKREGGKDIVVFGGGRLAHSLIRERLVDEFRLTVHPVALGEGLSLMHGLPEPQRFELISSTTYADGSVMQVLQPA